MYAGYTQYLGYAQEEANSEHYNQARCEQLLNKHTQLNGEFDFICELLEMADLNVSLSSKKKKRV